MRISSAFAAALLLAACSKGPGATVAASGGESAKPEDRIACALGGAGEFKQDCTVEHANRDGAPILIFRHPDGAFHRFEVLKNGGLAAADGAKQAQVRTDGAIMEVTLGSDRYRLPASEIGHAGP